MFKGIFVTGLIFIAQIILADPPPQFGDIARNADGSVRYMNQFDAVSYCASQGMHLPRIRELAQLAVSLGAAGISETPKDGYNLMTAKNADGKVDNFYFNYAGYKRPQGDLGNNWFWSSSDYSDDPYFSYVFDGSNGVVYVDYGVTSYHAVRCVTGLLNR
jgi:uncharacterized protein (TIGR02145 family)